MENHFEYAKSIVNSWPDWKKALVTPLPKPTHCAELCDQMTRMAEDVERLSCNFTAEGVEAIIRDRFDGQEYIMIVKPRRK